MRGVGIELRDVHALGIRWNLEGRGEGQVHALCDMENDELGQGRNKAEGVSLTW